MTNQHPITPPPELVDSIWNQFKTGLTRNLLTSEAFREAITKASQWGADQEMEACCQWLRSKDILEPAIDALRAARRPKPPSLKEQLLQKLEHIRDVADKYQSTQNAIDDLRETLEALND